MNGNAFPNGCPGAVNHVGVPAEPYCAGTNYGGGALIYPWWKDCCAWSGTECVPKGNILHIFQ